MLARLLPVFMMAVCVGCGKAPSSSTPEAGAPPPAVPSSDPVMSDQGSPPSAQQAEATDEAGIAAALNELTQVVRKYSVEQRRVPNTLEELVSAGYLSQAPQPPSGKRFAISKSLQVYLDDQ